MTWFRLQVDPAQHRDEALAALFAAGAQGVQEQGAYLVTHFPCEADVRAAEKRVAAAGPGVACDIEPAGEVDWSTAWQDQLKAVTCGRLVIVPPWLVEGHDPAHLVVIEPGMAFGTGDHASTRGAARLLDGVVRPGMLVADLGSGSGVLSIAAARLGAAQVWAIEADPDARGNLITNLSRNRVEEVVDLLEGDARVLLPLVAPVHVIAANILSSVILDLLPVMADALHPEGSAVIAGIMQDEREMMLRELNSGRWVVTDEEIEEEWWSARIEHRR